MHFRWKYGAALSSFDVDMINSQGRILLFRSTRRVPLEGGVFRSSPRCEGPVDGTTMCFRQFNLANLSCE